MPSSERIHVAGGGGFLQEDGKLSCRHTEIELSRATQNGVLQEAIRSPGLKLQGRNQAGGESNSLCRTLVSHGSPLESSSPAQLHLYNSPYLTLQSMPPSFH